MIYEVASSDDPARQLRHYLRPGESLLWAGRPDPSVHLGAGDLFLIPFSLLWGGFAVFWEVSVIASSGPLFFALWGIPFVAMGLYFIVGRFIFKHRQKRRTAYGITAERAIVAVGTSTMVDCPLQSTPVALRRSRDGAHVSITFGSDAGRWSSTSFYANSGMEFFNRGASLVAFYDVADPDRVLAAVDRARATGA